MATPSLPPLPARAPDAHKGDCGRILVIAGSVGMTGAGSLASFAALRSGAGLVTWAVPKSINFIAEPLATEVITLPIPETQANAPAVAAREHLDEASREANACLLGPGLPVAGETGELMRLLVPELHPPLVLDAGALIALGRDVQPIQKRKAATVITPHPGEMGRLTGKTIHEIQEMREEIAASYAKRSGAVVVLKGHRTVVSDGETTTVNETGNPGMATAGAGDVLGGIIAAFLGQRMPPLDASRLAVHLHGLAGDIAAETKGQHGLIARDILESLPAAFLRYAKTGADEA